MIRTQLLSLCMALAAFSVSLRAEEKQTEKTDKSVRPASYASYASEGCATCAPGGATSSGYNWYGNQAVPKAFGQAWGNTGVDRDCSRFYHYPYVFYPQNFRGSEYYRSSDSMYYRYPPEMQIPVYNRGWHNEYPSTRRYHWGHHFILDVF